MDKKKQIEKLLKENPRGLTNQEIADILKISRNTVAVALAGLNGEGKIEIREIGMSKLNYWKS